MVNFLLTLIPHWTASLNLLHMFIVWSSWNLWGRLLFHKAGCMLRLLCAWVSKKELKGTSTGGRGWNQATHFKVSMTVSVKLGKILMEKHIECWKDKQSQSMMLCSNEYHPPNITSSLSNIHLFNISILLVTPLITWLISYLYTFFTLPTYPSCASHSHHGSACDLVVSLLECDENLGRNH